MKNTCNASIESKGFCSYKTTNGIKRHLAVDPLGFPSQGISGFVVIPVRWVVERSNAWVERCKSLVKNFDRTLVNANARLKLCFIRLLLKRIAKLS